MKEIIRYQCEHCHKKAYASKYKARDHEKICFYNPEIKSCATCNNNTGDECFITGLEIFQKYKPIRNCNNWKQDCTPDDYTGA